MLLKSYIPGLIFLFFASDISVRAHDMWLVAVQPKSSIGQTCEIKVAVGMDFPNSISAIAPDRLTWKAISGENSIEQFDVQQNEKAQQTICRFAPSQPGLWIVGCTTRPNQIELEAKKFNDYLLHDGLPHVLAGRLDRDELGKDAVEQYSKYTKTMIAFGDNLTAAQLQSCKQQLGHKLEIIPLETPWQKRAGETLKVQVFFNRKPLNGANLCWDHPGNGEKFTGQTWTDEDGTAIVPVSQPGLMTLRLVHMTRPQTDTYEWESFWSSFTFSISNQ